MKKPSKLLVSALSAVLSVAPLYSSGCTTTMRENLEYVGNAVKHKIVADEPLEVYIGNFKNFL